MWNEWGRADNEPPTVWSGVLWCGVSLPCFGGSDGQWGAPCGKMCTRRSGEVVQGVLQEERKGCCGFFSDQRSVEWGQIHGLWHKSTSMGSTFLCKKILRTEAFPDQTRVFGVLCGHGPSLSPSRCVYFSLSTLQYIFNTTAVILLKCSSDHIASLLESFRIKFSPLTLAWEGFPTWPLLICSSPNILLRPYSSTNSIALSELSTFLPLSWPGSTCPSSWEWPYLYPLHLPPICLMNT